MIKNEQFHVVKEEKTWTDAQQYCREKFTDLATIHNLTDMEEIKRVIKDAGIGIEWGVWIGLKNGEWQWSLADEAKFRNWDTDDEQPDGREGLNSTQPYVLVEEEKTWPDAQRYCRDHYTDLASVRNQAENDNITGLLTGGNDDAWIGLFRNAWEWSDGSSSSFHHWNSEEPNNDYSVNGLCVEMWPSGWNDVSCHHPKYFVCYEDKLVLVPENKTWMEALQYCRQHHVDLVSVTSAKTQRWVEGWAKGASSQQVWLGLRYYRSLGFWFWINGYSVCYDNFASSGDRMPSCDIAVAAVGRETGQWETYCSGDYRRQERASRRFNQSGEGVQKV
ncbi:C-type mannose receptor 2-like [Engraulis encrasicolus]|uniref:C-type mannose receptor 2-like n=1 Tax=Engraulis encrasicolus TaxID=184585 RepID=UPI002FD34D41